MPELKLQFEAGERPSDTWIRIEQVAEMIKDKISSVSNTFQITEENLIYTTNRRLSPKALECYQESDVTLLQKSLIARQNETKGIAVIITWEPKSESVVTVTYGRSIKREAEVNDKEPAIFGVSVIGGTVIAGLYLGAFRENIPASAPGDRKLVIVYLVAIALIPSLLVGYIINKIYKTIKLPKALIEESESLAREYHRVLREGLKELGILVANRDVAAK